MRFFKVFWPFRRPDPDAEVQKEIFRLLKETDGNVNEHQLLGLIENLKKESQSVDFFDDYGKTALHLAAERGLTSVVMQLVSAHANIEAQDKLLCRPVIRFAIENGHKETVKCLNDLGASIKKKWQGRTVLHWAFDYGRRDVVDYLLDVGAKLNWEDDCYRTSIATARFGHGLPKDWILKKIEYQIDLSQSDGSEFFVCAAQARLDNLLTYLNKYCGVDVNTRRRDGKTALMVVVCQPYGLQHEEDETIVRLLCKMSADVNLQDKKGNTVLHYACENDSSALMKILIDSGAKPNILNKKGETPLDWAERFVVGAEMIDMLRHASTEDM
jgi:ankyrin repeat protein